MGISFYSPPPPRRGRLRGMVRWGLVILAALGTLLVLLGPAGSCPI